MMKVITLSIAVLLFVPLLAQANSDYKFKGDRQALAVCKAVLTDNPLRLDKTLKTYHQQNRALAYYIRKNDPVIIESFECNDMSLSDFSVEVGANKVARYLQDYKLGQPRVYVEDVAEQSSSPQNEAYFY